VISRICLLAACIAGALLTFPAQAETTKASSWVGRVVVTPNGELLGRIEDLALDLEARQVKFVVVSIGSFLVDDNLIAIEPDALGQSEDGRYLVVYSDGLAKARRFGAENWPQKADVLATAERQAVQVDSELLASETAEGSESQGASSSRTATISDGRRVATLKAGERKAQIESRPERSQGSAIAEVQPKRFQGAGPEPLVADSEFERLDENGDGFLSRSEIGPRLQRSVRYQDYDLDGNDGIDLFEFQLLKERS
jgi:sporulation protein YlmC with PRC-barrel domain